MSKETLWSSLSDPKPDPPYESDSQLNGYDRQAASESWIGHAPHPFKTTSYLYIVVTSHL